MTLDRIDKTILSYLQKNARTNASAIAEEIQMSVSAVIERIKKLENYGVIKQYTICVGEENIGNDVLAFVEVSIEHCKYNEVLEGIQKYVDSCPQILETHVVTGNCDMLLKVVTETMKTLERILNGLKDVNGVSYTRTSVVMSSLKSDVSPDFSRILETDAAEENA